MEIANWDQKPDNWSPNVDFQDPKYLKKHHLVHVLEYMQACKFCHSIIIIIKLSKIFKNLKLDVILC